MGPRYLIFVHDGQEMAARTMDLVRALAGFEVVLERADAIVLVEQGGPRLAVGDHGLVIGTMFEAGAGTPVSSLDEAAQAAFTKSEGVSLFHHVWGAYISICFAESSVSICRDPGGFLPCYHSSVLGMTCVASDVALIEATGLFRPDIAWDIVAIHLVNRVERPCHTALKGLDELSCGGQLIVARGTCRARQPWSPAHFMSEDQFILSEADAVAMLRETVMACVGAWSRLFSHNLLAVSGGLDSTIVAAAMSAAGANYSCLTLATVDPAGDERQYARLVAEAYGVDLQECFEDAGQVDFERSDAAHLPRPIARAFSQSGDRAQQAVAERLGIDAFVTGGGGDSVFCFLRSVAPLVDRLLYEGPGRGALSTARDLSRLGETSLGTVCRRALTRAYLSRRHFSWPATEQFRSQQAVARGKRVPDHPWRSMAGPIRPGKAMHLEYILGIRNFLEGFARERQAPLIAPLMSQPIVELCLRIPSWHWCADGQDRSIARKAFADLLPASLLHRRTKGTPTSFVVELFEKNRLRIRDILLCGKLAAADMIDLPALEAALAREEAADHRAQAHIMQLVDIEAWLASWHGRRHSPR